MKVVKKLTMEVGKKFVELHLMKFNLFKAQDPKTGKFDVEFEIGGKKLYVHKTMLNLVSDTFDSMLSDHRNRNEDTPIKIDNYSYDDFYQFITFFYTAQCSLDRHNIYALVDMAEFYGVQIFKDYCEDYLLNTNYEYIDAFKFFGLAIKYSLVQFKEEAKSYILKNCSNFLQRQCFLDAERIVVEEVLIFCNEQLKAEESLLAVYKWSEKQAIDKQKSSNDPMFNLNNAIKSEICDFLPYFDFAAMKQDFLIEFVVPRDYIFYSFDQVNHVLSKKFSSDIILKKSQEKIFAISNSYGLLLAGKISSDDFAVDYIKSLKNISSSVEKDGFICWGFYQIPPTPSLLTKRDSVDYYLICDLEGNFGVRPYSRILKDDYLIAEMFNVKLDSNWSSKNYKIEICE